MNNFPVTGDVMQCSIPWKEHGFDSTNDEKSECSLLAVRVFAEGRQYENASGDEGYG
jgi:hypothetical protein